VANGVLPNKQRLISAIKPAPFPLTLEPSAVSGIRYSSRGIKMSMPEIVPLPGQATSLSKKH